MELAGAIKLSDSARTGGADALRLTYASGNGIDSTNAIAIFTFMRVSRCTRSGSLIIRPDPVRFMEHPRVRLDRTRN